MNRRGGNHGLLLYGLGIAAALLLIWRAGSASTIVVPSGQAGGVEDGAPATPTARPERMTVDVTINVPLAFDEDGYLLTREGPTPTWTPIPTWTPDPHRTPRPTKTPIPSCPPASGHGYCIWSTPTPAPIYPTSVPTCGPERPGMGCIWTTEGV